MPNDHHPTRQQILDLVKRSGEMTARELSDAIGITTMGVRLHLSRLEREGLIRYRLQRQKIGRPLQIFSLTDAENVQFPSTYGQFALSILDQIASTDGEAKLEWLLEKRKEHLCQEYRQQLDGLQGKEKLQALAVIRDREGYMCETKETHDGRTCFVEHHCPIAAVARKYPTICALELELLETALGAKLVRHEHMLAGGKSCAYHQIV